LATVYFSARALADLDRRFDFIAEHDPASADRAAQRIADATRILRDHPLIGRPVRGDIRELVISSGRTGYVALYRLRDGVAAVEILTIRHQREAGYRE
jgi:plasmid stabilization system protein ParE